MFENPEAKRVRREDLDGSVFSDGGEAEEDEQIRAQLEEQIARSLGFDTAAASSAVTQVDPVDRQVPEGNDEDEDAPLEGYDFQLFGGSGSAPTKIVLEDDDEPEGDGGFVTPRPPSYYPRPDLSLEQRQMIHVAAVSGDDVIARSKWRAWSMELPWKVTHITVKKKAGSGAVVDDEEEASAKRRRPGKKRRLALRMKERARKEKATQAAKQKIEKEEHIKDKKKRMNRAKKLRRRQKEKEKKAGQSEAGSGSDDSE